MTTRFFKVLSTFCFLVSFIMSVEGLPQDTNLTQTDGKPTIEEQFKIRENELLGNPTVEEQFKTREKQLLASKTVMAKMAKARIQRCFSALKKTDRNNVYKNETITAAGNIVVDGQKGKTETIYKQDATVTINGASCRSVSEGDQRFNYVSSMYKKYLQNDSEIKASADEKLKDNKFVNSACQDFENAAACKDCETLEKVRATH